MMNRRSFFKKLGVGIAVAAVAPSALALMEPTCVAPVAAPATGYSTYVMGKNAFIAGYADYVNFSDFAISAAIDEHVAVAAEELGKDYSRCVDALYKTVAFGRS